VGGKIVRVPEVFSDLEKPGFQEEGINWMFVGGHTALPTILPSPSLGRDEVND
jgi:hypothetical protein